MTFSISIRGDFHEIYIPNIAVHISFSNLVYQGLLVL